MNSTRRLQIHLTEDQHRRIADAARKRGTSEESVVLEAINRFVPLPDRQRREAGIRILAADDMPVPEIAGLKGELGEFRRSMLDG